MKATHRAGSRPSQLQKLDQKESALRHKRDSHRARDREVRASPASPTWRAAITQSALIADTTREVTPHRDEIAKVSERRSASRAIDSNQVPPPRDISAMEHGSLDGSPPGQA